MPRRVTIVATITTAFHARPTKRPTELATGNSEDVELARPRRLLLLLFDFAACCGDVLWSRFFLRGKRSSPQRITEGETLGRGSRETAIAPAASLRILCPPNSDIAERAWISTGSQPYIATSPEPGRYRYAAASRLCANVSDPAGEVNGERGHCAVRQQRAHAARMQSSVGGYAGFRGQDSVACPPHARSR
jgi:hypothetical protein